MKSYDITMIMIITEQDNACVISWHQAIILTNAGLSSMRKTLLFNSLWPGTVKCRYNAVFGVQEIDRVIAVTAL